MDVDLIGNDVMAMVAHDLRNPLACIEGYASALQSIPMSEAERAGMLARILSCSRWASSLVKDLMDSAAIETGKLSLDRHPVPLESVIKETVDTFEIALRSKEIKLSLELSTGSMMVMADPNRIRQALHNLLGNALKYTLDHGAIRIAAYHFGDNVVVEVTDNGAGIEPDDQLLVFNKFYRKGGPNQGSLGLGLYIARAIIEAHAGFIGVRSEGMGKGSTFHFSLPIFDPERTYGEFKKLKGNPTPVPYKLPAPVFVQDRANASIQVLRPNR